MGIDTLKSRLPDYAKDLRLNLGGLVNASVLSEQQCWGAVVAVAAACAPNPALAELEAEARSHLAEGARDAALAAAAVMAMNNVYYRSKHLLAEGGVPGYDSIPARLRMQVIATRGGVAKQDFELWCLAVSAANGCGSCLVSHEQELRAAGMSPEQIHEGIRIAAVVKAVCTVLNAEQCRSNAATVTS